jgi:hypothetical protein
VECRRDHSEGRLEANPKPRRKHVKGTSEARDRDKFVSRGALEFENELSCDDSPMCSRLEIKSEVYLGKEYTKRRRLTGAPPRAYPAYMPTSLLSLSQQQPSRTKYCSYRADKHEPAILQSTVCAHPQFMSLASPLTHANDGETKLPICSLTAWAEMTRTNTPSDTLATQTHPQPLPVDTCESPSLKNTFSIILISQLAGTAQAGRSFFSPTLGSSLS